MEIKEDTIAAIATAQAPAGIGIIRISGPEAIPIADRIYRTRGGERRLASFAAGTFRYGIAVDADGDSDGNPIDEVIAAVFHAPHSYTGEDVVELQCHGGLLVVRRLLEAVTRAGARLAEPGEFTKRAFLHGRIDLVEAEAVMDVIAADSERSLRSAQRNLGGALSGEVRGIRQELLAEAAFIEAALDDPESYEGALEGYGMRLLSKLTDISARLERLLSRAGEGILLREGVPTVILGLPNAGKSSLLNYLAGRDRAIVTDIPGTTRDTLEERVRVGEITLRLIDTAGIAEDGAGDQRTLDPVERIGVERALQALDGAELVLFVVDVSEPVTDALRSLFARTEGRRRIVVANKVDLLEEAAATQPHDLRSVECAKRCTPGIGVQAMAEQMQEAGNPGALEASVPAQSRDLRSMECVKGCTPGIGVQAMAEQMQEEGNPGALEASVPTQSRDLRSVECAKRCTPEVGVQAMAEHLQIPFGDDPGAGRSAVEVIPFSARTGFGGERLREAISSCLFSEEGWREEDVIVTHARHRELLRASSQAISSLMRTIQKGMTEDFYTVELMDAYRALGEILGEDVGDDLVDEIFSKFCMGK